MSRWQAIRRVWATCGVAFTLGLFTWSVLAFRAQSGAHAALVSDARVAVTYAPGYWSFRPATPPAAGLIFFPGSPVDPVAYAPLARTIANAGYAVVIVELPRRGLLGGADGAEVYARAHAGARAHPGVARWVVAGHSRGGVVASRLSRDGFAGLGGLVLIGTSHPRDFSLAWLQVPVTRIYGTRDTVADVDKLERTRGNLPPSTRLVRIDGGNHSQFGFYGFQPGDWPATISREAQQAMTARALLDALALAATSR
jgi:pimeloyl-ACP methyl ester carboxylesterase